MQGISHYEMSLEEMQNSPSWQISAQTGAAHNLVVLSRARPATVRHQLPLIRQVAATDKQQKDISLYSNDPISISKMSLTACYYGSRTDGIKRDIWDVNKLCSYAYVVQLGVGSFARLLLVENFGAGSSSGLNDPHRRLWYFVQPEL